MSISAFNKDYLADNPDVTARIRRKIRRPKTIVLALKPKYAKAIYEGRKNWEFRKAPPPLFRWMFIYESAPVSAVTGRVIFSESVAGIPMAVMDIVKTNKCFTRNLTGISLEDLENYAGDKLVTALRVFKTERFAAPIPLEGKPPQNWGRYVTIPRPGADTKPLAPPL